MTCKHENADHLVPRVHVDMGVFVETFRCLDCSAYLSLGPANDTDAVKIEIRATELAHDGALASGEWNGYESLGWCSPDGRHLDLAPSESWTEQDRTVYVIGMLAAEIAAP